MTITNPLLLPNPIAAIEQLKPTHIEPAIKQIIQDNLAAIEKLVAQPNITWDNFVLASDELEDRLNKAWSPVSHLNSVCNSAELRTAYDQALAHLTLYSTQLGQHEGLFKATKSLYDNREQQQLSPTQAYILKNTLRGFKLSGLHLPKDKQQEFVKIQGKLAELKSKYEQNLLDATMSWSKLISDSEQLQGLPETELAMLAENAKSRDQEGYLITLEIPSYLAVMTYADDKALREELYFAYTTRASELGPDAKKYDNSDIMQQLLALKHAKAQLLGFSSYADLSLETKMAENPAKVIAFLEQLSEASYQQAQQEFAELKAFAQELGESDFKAWDVAYYSEKFKQQNFQISQTELRPYFPVDKVIAGLFKLTQHHFNVTFQQSTNVSVWHPDVKHFQVLREGKLVAEFYLDLYARANKRGGAWMDDYQGRYLKNDGNIQHPIAFLTCNFSAPIKPKPALLTHNEVVTLFHEFGHGLHHMLTQVNELSASGIANVPWDAVELPSQFMENFCYEPEVIAMLSGHFETDQPLPKSLLDKLIKAKNFQSAMMMVRQLEFSLFDMKIHSGPPLSSEQIQSVLDQTRAKVSVVETPSFNRFQNGFSHIFSGGYSAGYYSYKWAEVLSADAFSLFEELGVMNQVAGEAFLKNILEKGGSENPMTLFSAFRGREPSIDALLRHSGIKNR
ncbi:M3 family metallopeptidase [Aliikangiella sp. IMCC44632]